MLQLLKSFLKENGSTVCYRVITALSKALLRAKDARQTSLAAKKTKLKVKSISPGEYRALAILCKVRTPVDYFKSPEAWAG